MKNASRAMKKQPLLAVKTKPTSTAATLPLRERDFLFSPYREINADRAKLTSPRLKVKLAEIILCVNLTFGTESSITYCTLSAV